MTNLNSGTRFEGTYFKPDSETDHERGCRGEEVPDYCANCRQPYMAHRNGHCPVRTPKALITHGSDRPDLAHAKGENCELCSVLGMNKPSTGTPTLTLRKLRDRLSDMIATYERKGNLERADLPIHFSLSLERGRGQWYIPAEFVHGSPIGLRLPDGLVEVFEITGHEDKAIKNFAHRARRNSGKGTK